MFLGTWSNKIRSDKSNHTGKSSSISSVTFVHLSTKDSFNRSDAYSSFMKASTMWVCFPFANHLDRQAFSTVSRSKIFLIGKRDEVYCRWWLLVVHWKSLLSTVIDFFSFPVYHQRKRAASILSFSVNTCCPFLSLFSNTDCRCWHHFSMSIVQHFFLGSICMILVWFRKFNTK